MIVAARAKARGRTTLAALALVATAPLSADWVNLTGAENAENIAEIRIGDDAIEVDFELFPRDRELFVRAEGFGLQILTDGEPLTPQIVLREKRQRKDRYSPYAGMMDPRTRRPVPGPPRDKEIIFLQLRYSLPDRPQQLVLRPPMRDERVPAAQVGFLLYHKAAPVVDFRYLSQPETLHLDWDDPWYTAFENRNLVRHHRWPQMTFLYVEPRELRHESLVRVRDLMEWSQASPDVHRRLSQAEQARLKEVAGEYFASRNPVTIDGEPAQRSGWRAEFLTITARGLQVSPPDAPIDASAALLGITESYWVERLPKSASVRWQLFDQRIDRVPSNVVDPAGPYPGFLDAKDPDLVWTNYLRNWREPQVRPVVLESPGWLDTAGWRMTLLGEPDQRTAAIVVDTLLRRSAVAFLERDPQRLDAALALLVDPTAIDELRPELARIYAVPTTGGGVAGITAIGAPTLEELSSPADGKGFRALVRWQGEARGQHWGHVDRRRLAFRALMDVGYDEGRWRLRGLTVLEVRPVGS